MKIKMYTEFISESSINIKYDLINYFDDQKSEILSKGLDFDDLRNRFVKAIENLDPHFLEKSSQDLSNIDVSDKTEFTRVFEKILLDICNQLENSVNEGFFSTIKNIWNEIKRCISEAAKWISDRIWTISGYLTMGLAGLLFIINQWGGGLSMPEVFGNVLVNTVLLVGIALYKFGQKNDEYKNISEI